MALGIVRTARREPIEADAGELSAEAVDRLVSDLAADLAALRQRTDRDPFVNPIRLLALGILDRLRSGDIGEPMLEKLIQRMEKLEALAGELDGVVSAHAIRAGREVRVMVHPDQITDEQAVLLCRQIARRVKQELSYPNELRVTLLRESRVVEYSL